MKLTLVKCGLDHLAELASLSIKSYRQHYEYLWADRGKAYMQREFNEQTLKQHLSDPESDYFFAIVNKQPVGVLKLNYQSGILDYPPECCLEIQRIYLLSDQVGKGLGTEIFQHTESIARKKNLKVLWLMAMDSSSAQSFYQKCGFQVVQKTTFDRPGIRDGYKGMDVMIKLLD